MNVARLVVLATAGAVAVVGLWRGTWAVGGSDSSCYALMAAAFARGELQPSTSLTDAPWPNAPATFAPGGFIASPVRAFAASPVCTPGFSLLLAPLYGVGGRDAIFVLTPLAGSVVVWLTFLFGRDLGGRSCGVAAALIVATMPVFIFQLVQPMNDITAAALWTGVCVLAVRPQDHSASIGALTGLAVLVRPNLAPAAIVVGLWCATGAWRRFAIFAAAAAPLISVAAVLNTLLYGHALQSGYGATDELFSTANVAPNLRNYGSALLQTQLGFPLLGLVAPFVGPRHMRRLVALPIGITVAVAITYLLYLPFLEWWYLRFFLPVLPMLTVLAMAALVFGSRRTTAVWPVVTILMAYTMATGAMAQALDLQRLERRFRTAGAVARERLPANAVFLAVWQSGSVKYHASREVVVWDSLPPQAFDSTIAWLISKGHDPFIVVERWEEPLFRERFGDHSALGGLDWPPRFDVERQVRFFRPRDRDAYFGGNHIPTEYVITRESR